VVWICGGIIPVKDNSGVYVGRTTQETILKTDLNDIAEAFLEFAKKEGLSFSGK